MTCRSSMTPPLARGMYRMRRGPREGSKSPRRGRKSTPSSVRRRVSGSMACGVSCFQKGL